MKTIVCICTYNRLELLRRLLESFTGIDLGTLKLDDVEILVVDNNPTGEVRRLCEGLSQRLPFALSVTAEPEQGISFARNRAVAEALKRGADFVAFVDDDDMPEKDWLIRLLEKQRETQDGIVFGSSRPMVCGDIPKWLSNTRSFRRPAPSLDNVNVYGLPKYVGTGNVLISRQVLEKVACEEPIFDPAFALIGGGDKDFFIRARQNGATFALAKDSIVNVRIAADRQSVGGALRRAFRNGCSGMNMAMKHAAPSAIRRKRNKALQQIVLSALRVPLYLFNRERLILTLYKISRESGALSRYVGVRYHYYK